MFGLDLWFVYSVLSAIVGGLYIFTIKVAVERGYDKVTFNTHGPLVSAAILFVLTAFLTGFEIPTGYIFLFAALNAIVYLIGNFVRFDALGCIDTTIFYPLYKTLSPILTIIAGVYLFSEAFTTMEWYGLALSITVPLLLISAHEKHRQKNLVKGLWLLLLSAFIAALTAIILKFGTDLIDNLWLFAALSHTGMAIVGYGLLSKKQSGDTRATSRQKIDSQYIFLLLFHGITHGLSFVFFMMALTEGALGLVYTIQSLYILIPIILSIIFYSEHWNGRKVVAIIISILALALFQ